MEDTQAILRKVRARVAIAKNKEIKEEMKRLNEKIETIKIKGYKGDDGYTPVKGKDYFDGKDGKDGKDGYTPVKGKDYFDGKDGKNGKSPDPETVASKLKSDKEFTKKVKGKDGKDGKDGSPDTPYQVRDKLSTLKGNERLDAKHIKNINKQISLSIKGMTVSSDGSSDGDVGIGDVVGPSSSADNTIVLFDGTAGKKIKDSSITTDKIGDAVKIQGFDVAETDPTDGKILVYRTFTNSYVLEDKPVAGANPNAADVAFTPVGGLVADDVQEALEELDTEKTSRAFTIAMSVAL